MCCAFIEFMATLQVGLLGETAFLGGRGEL